MSFFEYNFVVRIVNFFSMSLSLIIMLRLGAGWWLDHGFGLKC